MAEEQALQKDTVENLLSKRCDDQTEPTRAGKLCGLQHQHQGASDGTCGPPAAPPGCSLRRRAVIYLAEEGSRGPESLAVTCTHPAPPPSGHTAPSEPLCEAGFQHAVLASRQCRLAIRLLSG